MTAKKFPVITLIGAVQIARVAELIAPLAGGEIIYEVIIRQYKSSRSLSQNNCLHGWCKQISQEVAEATGKFYPQDEWKKYLKRMFLGCRSTEINGEIITELISTKDLKVGEFAEFLTKIDHYAGSELHIILERGEDYALAIYGRKP